jgi:EAL domain-containing protein (putative c-di-GMP-specific phosphodiesterase class I)
MTAATGLTVMVVEDHGFQRRTLALMLRSLGAREVLQACDGKQALAMMRDGVPVDLIVCDLDMPEMDGMEFFRHLGQANSTAGVIISSAQERPLLNSVEEMALAYGVRLLGVIEKPVTLGGLEDLIAQHEPFNPQSTCPSASAPGFSLDQILDGIRQKQFEYFFQPKVDMATGRILGAEALARWRHPVHGLILPSAFIAPLEQGGCINELTFQLLGKAAHACCHWRRRDSALTVSVNLSLVSLTDTMLADRITHIVRSGGLEPRQMILEITETAAMTNVGPALENLTRLRMHGFGLSVDDYGTGFSSLQQLTRVPYSELKVDQSFVTGCGANPSLRAIVESSVEMARRLGIKSVAEGVESQADWDVLKAAGCDVAQGFFIAEAMDGAAFSEFCAAERRRCH